MPIAPTAAWLGTSVAAMRATATKNAGTLMSVAPSIAIALRSGTPYRTVASTVVTVSGLLLFVPDVSTLGYLRGPRVGAIVYNVAHDLFTGVAIAGLGLAIGSVPVAAIGVILVAHSGMDRMGYGLKLPTSFKDTHLGQIGRVRRQLTLATAAPRDRGTLRCADNRAGAVAERSTVLVGFLLLAVLGLA